MTQKRGGAEAPLPFFGPSDWFRTSGLVVPNHALYHLSYTRIWEYYTRKRQKMQQIFRMGFTNFFSFGIISTERQGNEEQSR